MKESHAWAAARRHLVPIGQFIRIENRLSAGTPDTLYLIRGVTGWMETKAGAAVTLDQVLFGEDWFARGGLWHLLLRGPGVWALFDAVGARHLYAKDAKREEVAKLWQTGSFPLRAVVSILAPR